MSERIRSGLARAKAEGKHVGSLQPRTPYLLRRSRKSARRASRGVPWRPSIPSHERASGGCTRRASRKTTERTGETDVRLSRAAITSFRHAEKGPMLTYIDAQAG